jgi:hypothetical protein
MFGGLAQLVRELDVPADGDALRELCRIRHVFDAKVAVGLCAFDRAGGWELEGATSLTGWMKTHAGQLSMDASREARIAKRLVDLPALTEAWTSGLLSTGQVEAVVLNVPEKYKDLFGEHEATVIPRIVGLSVGDTIHVMRTWKSRAEDGDPDPDDPPPSTLHASATLAGRVEVSGSLDAAPGSLLLKALQRASAPYVPDEPQKTAAERNADALEEICRFYLGYQPSNPSRRSTAHIDIVVHADRSTPPCCIDSGLPFPTSDVHRFLCDGAVRRVVTDGRSVILDMGTLTRVVTVVMRVALATRDRHCRFPGCDRPVHWCEAHHVWAWEDGGPTRLDNLVLLCSATTTSPTNPAGP